MKKILYIVLSILISFEIYAQEVYAQKDIVDYVNPFIGSTNYGTTNPGALCPQGLMSVCPFNVSGSELNKYDKDKRWWSTPYTNANKYLCGFSHVNLSGVGCPDMGGLLLMPISGDLTVDHTKYGSEYKDEQAKPGYYSTYLTKYGIKAEVSATKRTSIARFTFKEGQHHILMNLGEALTNETGAFLRKVNDNEIEGMKMFGSFCYDQNQAVFPMYFVMRINKKCDKTGYWKFLSDNSEVEKNWNKDAGTYKIYTKYSKEIAGDKIGAYFSFHCNEGETVEVQLGISFVSIENARLNLDTEQKGFDFEKVKNDARKLWNEDLSVIKVDGGSEDDKTVFYTALYHTLIHPNILQDVNGEYPAMESDKILKTHADHYTVFSLWDTYRNVHQLMSLLYPKRQLDMVNSMINKYQHFGWLPKWELFSRETLTMEGDPATIVIADTWFKGLKDFDIQTAYEAMKKSANTEGAKNILRPDNDDYLKLSYVPLREQYDNSVSHALEYYIADWNLSQLAKDLGYEEDAEIFYKRSLGYKKYYCKDFGVLRPKYENGEFYSPFDPKEGENFAPSPGFHEGNAWNYTFAVPHDIKGLIKLMGGKTKFVNKLQSVFDNKYFDVTNEPDINYPHFFSYIKGEEWRTQKLVSEILEKHFTNTSGGIPGNDDTGTMSAWAVFNMIGFYPDCPGKADYSIVRPKFDKITIKLDKRYYKSSEVCIEAINANKNSYLRYIEIDGVRKDTHRISHADICSSSSIKLYFE